MSQMPNQQMPQYPNQPPGRGPRKIAALIGQFVAALVKSVFWIVIGVAVLASGFVALRAIWWAVNVLLEAVGGI